MMFSFNIIYVTLSVHAAVTLYFECGEGEFEHNCSIYFEGDAAGDPTKCRMHRDTPERVIEAAPFGPVSLAEGLANVVMRTLDAGGPTRLDEKTAPAPIGFVR